MRQKTLSIEQIVLCGMFAALVATGAFIKISIPVQPFPMHFTLQFFFVLLAAFVLGGKLGSASVLAYLVIGLVGFPSLRQEADRPIWCARPSAFCWGLQAPPIRQEHFLSAYTAIRF